MMKEIVSRKDTECFATVIVFDSWLLTFNF